MTLAEHCMRWAIRLMPVDRADWARAMRREFDAIAPAGRLSFAAGCLWAAIQARIDAVQVGVALGRFGVAAVTAAYAGFHMWCLVNLLTMPEVAARAGLPAPWLALYLGGMGLGNGLAALCLAWWRPKPFMAGWAIVAVTSAVCTTWGVARFGVGHGTIWGWQFVPLALLAGAAAGLAWIANLKADAKAL